MSAGRATGRTYSRGRARAATLAMTCLGCTWLAAAGAIAATPLTDIRVSPDIPLQLGSTVVGHENVVRDDLHGTLTLSSIGTIPHQADLDAYHRLPNGDQLLSFDTTVTLPGGLTAAPGDIVRFNGSSYVFAFQAAPIGVPRSANVDAVAVKGSALVMSFDVAVTLNGITFQDEDLALFDGALFSMFFDGSAAGIDPRLDLDAADLLECDDHLLLSFDGSGAIGGVAFDDEDVLEYDRVSTWQKIYDGSAHDPAWAASDLDAVSATVDLGSGPPVVFGQTVRVDANKTTFRWTSVVAFRAVRGAFASPHDVGLYTVNLALSGTGASFSDPAAPAPGTGSWYLVKPGGCFQSSWQSSLGAEPGRDPAIP